jgi:hypothetical protein
MKLSQLNAALGTGDSAEIATEPGTRASSHSGRRGAAASATVAALATGKHVCKGISASIACGALPRLRFGSSSAMERRAPGRSCGARSSPRPSTALLPWIDVTGLLLRGERATRMTLEFTGGGTANSEQDVTLSTSTW